MAISTANSQGQATATGTGFSPHIVLPEDDEYLFTFASAGAFVIDIQMLAGDNATWNDAYDQSNTKVTINSASGRQNFVGVAGAYRMNVTTYNNPITMYARKV